MECWVGAFIRSVEMDVNSKQNELAGGFGNVNVSQSAQNVMDRKNNQGVTSEKNE